MILLLAACFTPEAETLVVESVKFENPHTQHPNLLLQPFTYPDLECPDGQDASFYAIYQDALTEPAPVVVVFHAGAFDYVEAQDLDADGAMDDVAEPDDEAAPHYAGENRLSSEWASNKVFETLGILRGEGTDSSEVNSGALPAALADAGAFAIYPANCFGDLGHNESGLSQNDADYEAGVKREGLALHWGISAGASPDQEISTAWITRLGLDTVPIPLDWSGVYYVGLGEGGRAIAELVLRPDIEEDPAPVRGILIDSTMDNLGPLAKDDTNFRAENDGLARIFPDYEDVDGDDAIRGDVATCNNVPYRDDIECPIAGYSLWWYFSAVNKAKVSYPVSVWYSSADPRVPTTTLEGLLALDDESVAANAHIAPALDVHDVGTATHVQLNDEIEDARRAVETLLTPLATQ